MNRAEFMRQLEQLLQDISESERQEALDYYNSYFDDAGAENESAVIQELGSPGKVAAIIKADLESSAEEYAQYTEQGYQDSRQQSRDDLEVYEYGNGSQSRAGRGYQPPSKKNAKGNLLLIIIILILSCWIWGPILIGGLAAAFGVLAAVAVVILLSAILGPVLLVVAVVMVIFGIVGCFSNPGLGLLLGAIGFFLAALAILLILAFVWIAVKFMPWFFRKVVDICQGLLFRMKKERGV